MPADPIARAESALRAAILTGAHGEARSLLAQYCSLVADAVRSLPAGDPQRALLAQRATQFLLWARGMALCMRARIADQFREVAARSRYAAQGQRRPVETWRFQA